MTDSYEPTASMLGTHVGELSGRFYEGATVPSEPETSDMWYHTDDDSIFYFNGSSWIGAALT